MTEETVGYRIESSDGLAALARDGEGRLVQLLRVRVDDPVEGAAVDALLTAAGPHVQRVLDVGRAVNGDLVVVLEPLPYRLTDLLAVAGWPTAPEAVTVLVPLIETVDRLHREGIAHGGFGAVAVRFDEAGTPTVAGFESSVLRNRDGEQAFASAAAADRVALRGLLGGLLRRTGAAGALLAADLSADDCPTDALIDALFDLAEPRPIRLRPLPQEPPPPGVPSRLLDPAEVPAEDRPPVVRRALRRAAGVARTVRARVWVAAAAAVALLVTALVLLPGRGADARGTPAPATRTAVPGTLPSSPAPSPAPTAPAGGAADPVTATAALLGARNTCFARQDAACLAAVDATGSPVAGLDSAALTAGVEPVVPSGPPRLRSRSGSTAVLDVGGATVLIAREPEGWRLRDVVRAPR